jgi:hypothetical protein
LPSSNQQTVCIAIGYYRVTVRKAYTKRAVSDYFRKGEIGSLSVKVAFYDLEIGSYAPEKFKGFSVGEVTQAEDLADFARRKEFLELSCG